ncbi:RagB/SusD family nutrient uptake outer membrane protein [uncultured Pontibacter sp.]|uniref:RagB/SusD family nutrient uptake outer membrane protein n=1 Tax=uncultured Pontibacter sp. TaxID=453356 RepID=UPI0026059355|nr:RagB/SusD family nutrient uptake outer membrane protein [uncultured Pontibacter sp.]
MSLLSATMLLGSCKDEFLEKEPHSSVPIVTAITTEDELGTAVTGLYASMRTYETWGRNIPVLGDLLADNTYISADNAGRYLTQNAFRLTPGSAEPTEMWNNLYETILRANVIINAELPNADEATVGQYKGEAYAIRALAFHELVKFFATPYSVNPSAPGVPVVTEFNAENLTDYYVSQQPKRNTVAEVYEQIIADYDEAYRLMGKGAANSSYISKYAAKALQARAYLFMGEGYYDEARDAALDVYNNGSYSLIPATDYVSYWSNPVPVRNRVETIFEISIDAIDNNGSNALANMYDQGGYGDIVATPELYNLYAEDDVRKDVIEEGEKANEDAYFVNKYTNRTNASDKDDIKVIRYSEVLLTLAEAYARTGAGAEALDILNELTVARNAAEYTSSGDQLIQDILTERRKELAFEGDRYWTFMRLNLPVQRTDRHPSDARLIPVGDDRRLQPIPQGEIDANPNILPQNPGYGG